MENTVLESLTDKKASLEAKRGRILKHLAAVEKTLASLDDTIRLYGGTTERKGSMVLNVEPLELQGMTQKQIAAELGFKSTFTLNNRLVKASQATGKSVPAFSPRGKNKLEKRVEVVEVKQRGKGQSFGVNIPMEPLVRAGVKPGTRLSVKASKGRIVLTAQ